MVEPPGTVYRRAPAYERPPEPELSQTGEHTGSLAGYLLSPGKASPGNAAGAKPRSRAIVIALVIVAGIAVLAGLGLVAMNTLFNSILG